MTAKGKRGPTRLKPVQFTANKGCNPRALPLATAVGPWREFQQQANSWVRTQLCKELMPVKELMPAQTSIRLKRALECKAPPAHDASEAP